MVRVLFICLGNICRSPMAEAVFRKMVADKGLLDVIDVDSAGIGDWHVGEKPHRGTQKVLTEKGIEWETIRSRQVTRQELQEADYVVAMDDDNMRALERLGAPASDKVFRLLDLVDDAPVKEVPDPYYDGRFDHVYELVTAGCEALLRRIERDLAERA
ncbi:low molecular weight protein-tyrosine-phosphatase [Alicyclobacillus acidiphilus]|uniref:low molecular weight protein-tyrosine-phosphatase n=1 Tax=Alicyclobacillus acidiphilus TaxID=182455 RepID=UPI000835DBBF|nr:low molecular weight protein-tyrosine-phosphatase [Alicyclobacillus acidiphilus]